MDHKILVVVREKVEGKAKPSASDLLFSLNGKRESSEGQHNRELHERRESKSSTQSLHISNSNHS